MAMQATDWSITGLATELKMSRERIARAVENIEPVREAGKVKYYRMAEAVRALFEVEDLHPAEERAKLDRARREKVELELAARRGELVEVGDVEEAWSKRVIAVRARMLAMPNTLAPQVAVESNAADCQRILKESVYAALSELAQGESGA